MYQSKIDQTKNHSDQPESDIFFDKVPDEAIERAVDAWRTGGFTMGNCTGLGSCPA